MGPLGVLFAYWLVYAYLLVKSKENSTKTFYVVYGKFTLRTQLIPKLPQILTLNSVIILTVSLLMRLLRVCVC